MEEISVSTTEEPQQEEDLYTNLLVAEQPGVEEEDWDDLIMVGYTALICWYKSLTHKLITRLYKAVLEPHAHTLLILLRIISKCADYRERESENCHGYSTL